MFLTISSAVLETMKSRGIACTVGRTWTKQADGSLEITQKGKARLRVLGMELPVFKRPDLEDGRKQYFVPDLDSFVLERIQRRLDFLVQRPMPFVPAPEAVSEIAFKRRRLVVRGGHVRSYLTMQDVENAWKPVADQTQPKKLKSVARAKPAPASNDQLMALANRFAR